MADDPDRRFLGRVEAAIATVKAWDADPSLLEVCRKGIPLDEISSEKFKRDDDVFYTGNALFLKRFTLYFKTEVMTWVNNPPCNKCGNKETQSRQTRGPETPEERAGGAGRVEVYECPSCNSNTTFPRYNSVKKLLETKQGRCGEFANLFGLYCRAVGFETRYCSDFTDHVWVECLVDGNRWIMADACEGLIDKVSMYESGWNKKLSYIIGVTTESVVDVTPRYTRQFYSDDFQARRRGECSSEQASQQIVQQCNATLQQSCSKARREELERRAKSEQRLLTLCQQATEWTDEEKHGQGRISGSLQWKLSRKEAGNQDNSTDTPSSPPTVQSWHVESFQPQLAGGAITIRVSSADGIHVSSTKCSVVGAAIAVVVIDEKYLGCILQSRGFSEWKDVSDFIETLPKHRIVAIQSKKIVADKDENLPGLSRLGGFSKSENGVLYLGQVEAHPSWTQCSSTSIHVEFSLPKDSSGSMKLRTERDTVPHCVASRLPEHAMPLETQLRASEEQKRTAFFAFAEKCHRYVGYTTKPGAPIYLLDASAYPFEESQGEWNTFHYLPEPLVPKDDVGITETKGNAATPKFDIPLESDFFTSLLGPTLATSNGAIPTISALHNTRLVALYFSAHWCPPCRRFTPMLAELYEHLKEEFPTHGLEVVFVTSDRDPGSFQQYYGSMPWLAVPFGGATIPQIKARYGVNGIPALVVLDAMSGQIVVSMSDSRREVMQACQGGDEQIEEMLKKWLTQIPQESQEIMSMLEMSCEDNGADDSANEKDRKQKFYLVRSESDIKAAAAPVDPAKMIKQMFSKFVAEGLEPNAAAAKAIQMVADQQKKGSSKNNTASFGPGPLSDIAWKSADSESSSPTANEVASNVTEWNTEGQAAVGTIITTAQKYLENAMREPWTPKFRTMRLSNKVVDRITRLEGAVALITSLGFYVYATETDFYACIPLGANLETMSEGMNKLLSEFTPG